MTTISSTSPYSYANASTVRTSAVDGAASLSAPASSTRSSVYSGGGQEVTATDSSSIKLSSQLLDLLDLLASDEEDEEDASGLSLETATTNTTTEDTDEEASAADEFLALADMTLADRIRSQYLEDNELTEDDLETMPAEERSAVEDEIRQTVMETLGIHETDGEMPLPTTGEARRQPAGQPADDGQAT